MRNARRNRCITAIFGVLALFVASAAVAMAATVTGTPNNDRLIGSPGDDQITALAGNDKARGLGGTAAGFPWTGNAKRP